MTDHADLSRRLAVAIGWPTRGCPSPCMVALLYEVRCWDGKQWRDFDYRDPAVIWPIAERFACFPFKHSQGGWWAWCPGQGVFSGKHGDTAAEAVARAVIGAHE